MQTLGIDIGGGSLKIALMDGSRIGWKAQSESYTRPSREQLTQAIRETLLGKVTGPVQVGLCVPGLLDEMRSTITYSVNLPVLVGLPLRDLVCDGVGIEIESLHVINDAHAAAVDIAHSFGLAGRVLVLALGTGVGAAVLDNGRSVSLDGDSPGHIGQLDVSLDADPPIGPDGGAGSLEAYVGTPALVSRYGSMEEFFKRVRATDPPMLALARAIRIAHAIYRPNHVVLGGGVGIRLKHLIDDLKRSIDHHLTGVAQSDWTLRTAEHDFHAALGAARIAAEVEERKKVKGKRKE